MKFELDLKACLELFIVFKIGKTLKRLDYEIAEQLARRMRQDCLCRLYILIYYISVYLSVNVWFI